jgi:arylsulfatase A-like enzyme
VSTVSLMPTVLDLLSIEGSDPARRGLSLAALIEEPDPAATRNAEPIVSSGMLYFEQRSSVRSDRFKYVVWHESGLEELFDLAADPAERVSVADVHPERVAALRARLAEARLEASRRRVELGLSEANHVELSPDREAELRAMGYIR